MDFLKYLNIEIISYSVGVFLLIYSILNISFTLFNITFPKLEFKRRLTIFILSIFLNGIGLYSSFYHSANGDKPFFDESEPKQTSYLEQTFSNPLYRGERLDICVWDNGVGCGMEAATKWCRQEMKFKIAADFDTDLVAKKGIKTKRMGDEFVCDRKDICTAFKYITCLK